MIDLADIDSVLDLAKRYRDERRKYARISERSHGENTPKQAQKLAADLNWQAMELLKIEANLHTACVDAQLADLRSPEHYGARIHRPSGWHEYTFTPAQPRALA